MTQGLRERKKAETSRLLWHTAITLFLERGFENVSVAEIAQAANVSKMTVFNYFPSKEDIVVRPMNEHVDEPAQVVRDRRPGQSAVDALREHFLGALRDRDAFTGLNDVPTVLAVTRLVTSTPSLVARVHDFANRTQTSLARALAETTGAAPDDLLPRLAAAQLTSVQFTLSADNRRALSAGQSADERYPTAKADAEQAFALLDAGLHGYATR
jgi:AcrR family transcriptional regulator